MATETILITDETRAEQKKLIAGRKVVGVSVDSRGKTITLSDEVEADDLSLLVRRDLDKIATDLGINPEDYSTKAKLIKAIEDAQQ